MTILAAYGVPRAKFYDWVVNNGCGYSIRIMPSLWMRQKVCEVYSKVPNDLTRENDEESMYILDLVREASNTAYGYNHLLSPKMQKRYINTNRYYRNFMPN